MASFSGSSQKCVICDKTAYVVDQLTADGRVYHKACFRCHHCRNTLKLSNYCSFEGVLYCRPHYDQLYKRTGSLDKSFEGTPKIQKPEKQTENENAKVLSNVFVGTKDKCEGCKKTVYPTERVSLIGTPYHKGCFKCSHGGCTITLTSANFITHEGKLYCKHHHVQLFKEKGNYSQLDGDKEKNIADEVSENGEVEDINKSNDDANGNGEGDSTVEEESQLCDTEPLLVLEASLSGQQDASCSCSSDCVSETDNSVSSNVLGDPSDGINLPSPGQHSVSSSTGKECEVPKENVVGDKDNQAPPNVLDKLNFQLLDKSGREMKIKVTYKTNEKKKKRAHKDWQKLSTSVNCGGSKGGNGKTVKQ